MRRGPGGGRRADKAGQPPTGDATPSAEGGAKNETASKSDWLPTVLASGAAASSPVERPKSSSTRTPLRRIGQNALHLLGSQALSFAMALVASVVMARTLGPNDLGIFHQSQWFAGTVSVFLSLGLCTSITKFTAQFRSQGRALSAVAALRFLMKFEMGLSLVSTALLLLFSRRIADYSFSPAEGVFFAISFLGLAPGLQTALYSSALEGAQVFRYQSLHALTLTPLALLAKIGVLLWGFGLSGILWCTVIVSLANLAFFAWAARREGLLAASNGPPDQTWKGEVFKYQRSLLGIHVVDLLVWSRTENFFLGRFCTASQIAYYNLALNLLQRLTGTIPNLMWKILLPLATELHGAAEHDRLARTFTHSLRYTAWALFPLITFCWVTSYELVVIFYGHAYTPARSAFQILCASALLSALAQPSSAAIYASNRQRFILWYGSILAVLNIGLNFWLIPPYGAVGAAWSYSVTTSLGVLGGFVFVRRTLHMTFPWRSWFKAAGASLLMGFVLWWFLRWDFEIYSLFSPWQDRLQALTGKRLDMFFGERTVRVACGAALSALIYSSLLAAMANPKAEDLRILRALEARLPTALTFPLTPFLRRWVRRNAAHAKPRETRLH